MLPNIMKWVKMEDCAIWMFKRVFGANLERQSNVPKHEMLDSEFLQRAGRPRRRWNEKRVRWRKMSSFL